jgi:hypothetical protein
MIQGFHGGFNARPQREIRRLALAYGKTCYANGKVIINPFLLLLLLLLLPLLWLEECDLLRG